MTRVARFSKYLDHTLKKYLLLVRNSKLILYFIWQPSLWTFSDVTTLLVACLILAVAAQNSVVTVNHNSLIPSPQMEPSVVSSSPVPQTTLIKILSLLSALSLP